MPSADTRHVYLTRLELQNVRSFGGTQVLELTDSAGKPARWTLVIGENGVGKTTLLQCLAMMRPILANKPDVANAGAPDHVEPDLFNRENDEIEDLARVGEAEVSLKADFVAGHVLGKPGGRMQKLATEASFTMKGEELDTVDHSSVRKPSFVEPLVIGYGAARHVSDRTGEFINVQDEGTASLFDPTLPLADAQQILEELDYAAFKKRPHAAALLESVKAALVTLLPDVPNAAAISLYGPATPGSKGQKTGVQIATPYGEVPLYSLSLGYQTMTAWAVDLAWRLYQHFPDADDPLAEPAIVLIDELDLHLHPRWQRELRSHMSTAFPQVQFIATAHSPLLAQSYLDTNIAVVREEEGQAVILNDPEVIRTWRIDELMTSVLYDLDSPYSPEVTTDLARRTKLLQKTRLTPAEKEDLARLQDLAASLSVAPTPEDQGAMDILRRAAKLLEPGNQ
ncbi:MAG TPA: AAA family ATPase [Phenylobacterium sp.]|nr:AAA family ATPase [Phenylobacterium sp.]